MVGRDEKWPLLDFFLSMFFMRAGLGSLFCARLNEEDLKLKKSEQLKSVKDTLNLVFHENLNFLFLARCNVETMFHIAQEVYFLTVET
jgi:hypothetical protein